jgi:hypothetical protein
VLQRLKQSGQENLDLKLSLVASHARGCGGAPLQLCSSRAVEARRRMQEPCARELVLRQYLYFCTSKASKLQVRHLVPPHAGATRA